MHMPLTFAKPTSDAIALHFVSDANVDGVLSSLSESAQRWAEQHSFLGKHGQVLAVPDLDGRVELALVGAGSEADRVRNRFVLGGARQRLPSGTYTLATELDDDQLAEELLGWLLAGYSFGRYRETSN
jgi:leucyl aminopeptidase